MGWVEEALAREQGRKNREKAASSADAGYIGGFISSAVSGVGEMFGMEPFPTADRFRMDYPISGVASEIIGFTVPYAGWEGVLAKAPRLAATLEGAAGRLGLNAVTQPVRYGAANLAIRYAPVELSRLGTGMFLTDDWDKYGGLMADVGLSTMLAGGFGGIGGFLRSGGKIVDQVTGRVAQAPVGLAAPFEYRLSKSPSARTFNNEPIEAVQQKLFREALTERPAAPEGKKRRAAIQALAGTDEPAKVAGVNFVFNESKGGKTGGLLRQKLMQDNGTWTLGDEGNQALLGALGRKSMEEIAEAGRFATFVRVGSDRAAGTLRKAVEGLSPVGDGAYMGREAGDGLFIVGVRTKIGEATEKARNSKIELERQLAEISETLANPIASKGKLTALKAAQRKLYTQLKKKAPDPVGAGDEWFFIKTDRPDLFVKGAPKAAKLTFNMFAKFRDAFRPEVNQDTIFNLMQNRAIQTFTPENIVDIKAGRIEKARAAWGRRLTKKVGEGLGIADSEMLERIWRTGLDAIKPSMFKGISNSLYDRQFFMLNLNKQTGESIVNSMVGGPVRALRRKGFGGGFTQVHEAEVAPGIKTLNALFGQHKAALTDADYQLIATVGTSQAPKEALAELTANGLVSPAARAVMDGLEKLDKWFWSQMLPVAKSLGLDAKFSLLEGPYLPVVMKGDNYVAVVDDVTKQLKFIASGTRQQAIREAESFVQAAKEMGLNLRADRPRSWYEPGDEMFKLKQQWQLNALKDPQVQEIAKKAARSLAIENAGLRPGMMRGRLPKTLTEERGLTPEQRFTGQEYSAKGMINDLQSHYNMIARFLGHESWLQRWGPELTRLRHQDYRLHEDLMNRGRMMLGYEGKTATLLNKKLQPFFGHSKLASKIAQETNKVMYHWNLGLPNPVFALVNLLTPLQTVAPWIAMMKVAPEAADDLMHTTFRYGADGKARGIWNTLDIPKLMFKALKEIGKPGDELLEFFGRAKTDGGLSPQLYENFAGHGSAASVGIREAFNRAGGGAAGSWEAMKNMATWMSRNSEEWSREYAFTAAYIVGRDLKGLSGEALYQFARRGTHVTQYGYHAMDRSMLFTGPLGSTFGLFKNWQMHFIGSMFQYAGLGWREGIWAPLIWQFAGSLAVGGLGATPLVLVADQITDWMDNQPNSYLWMKENWHDAADTIHYGFPALFGFSLQASSALPGTDIRNDLTMLSNFVFLERAQAAFKATKGAWDYAEQNGENPLKNENIRDALLQGFAPRALWRMFATTEGDAIKSMSSGYPQVRDVTPLGQLAYRLGFNPVEIESQQDAARYLWKDQQAQREAISQLGIRLADAELNRDYDEIQRTIAFGVARGLPMDSVAKSAQTRIRREQQQDLLSKYGYEGQLTRMAIED